MPYVVVQGSFRIYGLKFPVNFPECASGSRKSTAVWGFSVVLRRR